MMYREGKSSYQIAEHFGTYSTKILRALKYLGEETRSYKDAQKLALETGRSKHPTEGISPSQETRDRISEKRSEAWDKITPEERERLSQISKTQWENMTDAEKKTLRDLAGEAVRAAAKTGSKTERFVRKGLTEAGWTVRFHDKTLLTNKELEIDLFVSDLKTAIEIDGPAHFLPIWGEESLQKHQRADAEKTGLLINNGYVIVRVKQMTKSLSQIKMRNVLSRILEELDKIAEQFPDEASRLIEIEV